MFAAVCRETYRVSCQIIRTPAFPPAKVFQVVEVVDPRRKRHLSADWVKLLQTNTWDRGGSRRLQTYTHILTDADNKAGKSTISSTWYVLVWTGCMQVTSYLIEATWRQVWVAVALCTNVRRGQTVALPINLLTEAQRAHLDRSRQSPLQST